MKAFKLDGQRFFLTFAQCNYYRDAELNLVLGYHIALLPPLSYYVMCREQHMDGNAHFHVVLVFKDRVQSYVTEFFDWMFDQHPNIRPIEHGNANIKRRIDYVKKFSDWVEDGVSPVIQSVATMQRISKLILENKSVEEIDLLEHAPMIMHAPKVAASVARQADRLMPALKPWVVPEYNAGLQAGDADDYARILICRWLEDNIRKPRDYRQVHLWIWGPGRIGKSRLCFQLKTMLKIFDVPDENKEQMTGYSDSYDLVVFDDYHHSKSVTFLKKFLQAYPMKVAQKSIGPVTKNKHVPCLFTSNKPPQDAYKFVSSGDPQHFIPLLDRLLVVQVNREFNLFP